MTQKQIDALNALDAFNEEYKLKPSEYFNYFKDFNTRTLMDSGKRDEIIKSSYALYAEKGHLASDIKEGLRKLSIYDATEFEQWMNLPYNTLTWDEVCVVWRDDKQIAYFLPAEDDADFE